MLDDLRRMASEEGDDFDFDENFVEAPLEPKRFLGMTAVERMFLAIFFFMNVVIIGLALLLATGRIVL